MAVGKLPESWGSSGKSCVGKIVRGKRSEDSSHRPIRLLSLQRNEGRADKEKLGALQIQSADNRFLRETGGFCLYQPLLDELSGPLKLHFPSLKANIPFLLQSGIIPRRLQPGVRRCDVVRDVLGCLVTLRPAEVQIRVSI